MTLDPRMKTKTIHSDYYVAVEIAEPYRRKDISEAERHQLKVRELEVARRSISRHIDDVEGVASVWTTTTICAHCEIDVKDGFIDGEPACCTEAQEEYVSLGYELS